MGQIVFELTGETALLQHNERMADPLSEHAQRLKALTGKRKKTLADHEEIGLVEWEGSLYHDEKIGPYIPATWIDAMMRDSGKLNKLGTAVTRGVRCIEDMLPLQYEGPRKMSAMWKAGLRDRRTVGNQASRVVRTRPRFPAGWTLRFSVDYQDDVVNAQEVIDIVTKAGRLIGLGDYRPRFGRFAARVVKD